jgi:hypothetical protein
MEKAILEERINYIRKRLYRIQIALNKEQTEYKHYIENCVYNPQYTTAAIFISEMKYNIEMLNEQYGRYMRKYERAKRRLSKM